MDALIPMLFYNLGLLRGNGFVFDSDLEKTRPCALSAQLLEDIAARDMFYSQLSGFVLSSASSPSSAATDLSSPPRSPFGARRRKLLSLDTCYSRNGGVWLRSVLTEHK